MQRCCSGSGRAHITLASQQQQEKQQQQQLHKGESSPAKGGQAEEGKVVAASRTPRTSWQRDATHKHVPSQPLAAQVWGPAVSTRNYGPVFEEQPRNILFPEGSTEEQILLVCHARASPPATYKWKKNGTEIKMEPDSRYRLNGGNLVISNPVKAKDTGSYQCVASNSVGTVLSREAFVRFGFLQEFSTEERHPVRVTEGRGVMFSCNPPLHYPGLAYRWFVNEFPNFVPADGRRFISQTTGNLYIAKTEASDLGNYSCFVTGHIDSIIKSVFSTSSQLTLVGGDSRQHAPSIQAKFPSDTYALAGQLVALECFAFGNPIPQIKWRKLEDGQSSKWIAAEPLLQFKEIGFEDEGTYECVAKNVQGTDSSRGRIIIQAQPEWLKVIADKEADLGSNLHWSCAAAGKPRPTIRWLRNGQPLTSQNRIEVNGGDLRILKLTMEDSGMYQCVGENKHGIIYASAELSVQDFRLNPVRGLIPAARGGEIIIHCQPRTAPKSTILWTKGTELLKNSSSITITPDGTLIIRNISKSDEGKYTCFAENFMGKANSTGIISVRDATKITLAPSSADINVGENITLQCHASHDPTMDLTFTWSLDLFPIDFVKSEGHYKRASTKESIGDLMVMNAQLKHAGRYTCTAQTVVDSASESATLVVRGPPGPPGGLVVRNIKDTTVQLSWSRGFDNHSPIAKYIIQARTPLFPKWKQVRTIPANIEGNTDTAQVVNLIPWMDYEFRVLASNILGVGEPSVPSAKIRTSEAPPTVAPSGLSGGGGAPGELIINWTPMQREYQNGDGFGYILSFRQEGTHTWKTAKAPHAESLHYVYRNESVAPFTAFEVKIRAFNRKGEGPESLVSIVHSAEEEPRVAPSNVTVKAVLATEMDVFWEPVERSNTNGVLLGYEIRYWKHGDKEEAADRVRTAGLVESAHVTDLNPNTKYHVAVRAYNRAGPGPASSPTSFMTTKPPPRTPPGNISWKFSGSIVSIRWDAVVAKPDESAVTGYKMLYQQDKHSTPRLYIANNNRIEIPVPEDSTHASVQIRTTGPGGDGDPAKVYILRNSGTSMMVENSAGHPVAHTMVALTHSIVMLALIGYLEL
ncbi:contactin-2 isoform X2 [Hemicordylus capensis]|uniref:contactin-2 isoform X2 n=1 Tax=Hemicordylus capensis TaxID=884348 RepID=UPI002304A2BE|nr:contactin-2 isoform X2 [Hemicordylus capensis]